MFYTKESNKNSDHDEKLKLLNILFQAAFGGYSPQFAQELVHFVLNKAFKSQDKKWNKNRISIGDIIIEFLLQNTKNESFKHIMRSMISGGYQHVMNEIGHMIIAQQSEHLPRILSSVVLFCYTNTTQLTTVRNLLTMIDIPNDSGFKNILKLKKWNKKLMELNVSNDKSLNEKENQIIIDFCKDFAKKISSDIIIELNKFDSEYYQIQAIMQLLLPMLIFLRIRN